MEQASEPVTRPDRPGVVARLVQLYHMDGDVLLKGMRTALHDPEKYTGVES
jgi:hypothetical protein